MADLTRAEMIDRVLEHIGVKPAGQSATAEDSALVGEAIDAAHDRLNKFGLVPFATSAIPTWAQVPFRDFVAGDVGQSFGFGERFKPSQAAAERELARQLAGKKHNKRVRAEYF
jgi:hypothetical protein